MANVWINLFWSDYLYEVHTCGECYKTEELAIEGAKNKGSKRCYKQLEISSKDFGYITHRKNTNSKNWLLGFDIPRPTNEEFKKIGLYQ